MQYSVQVLQLTGDRERRTRVYAVPALPTGHPDPYWGAVTDVPCPADCGGTVRWAEAGYVPGYRICDQCGRHYMARGTMAAPVLALVGGRRGA